MKLSKQTTSLFLLIVIVGLLTPPTLACLEIINWLVIVPLEVIWISLWIWAMVLLGRRKRGDINAG